MARNMKKTKPHKNGKVRGVRPIKDRHNMTIVVVGETAIGKTYRTLNEILCYLQDNKVTGKKGRKVLIFDVNDDDYIRFITLHLDHIRQFKQVRARRIRPLTKSGRLMTLAEKRAVVEKLVTEFKDGLLVLEDLDKYMVGAKGQTIVGVLCANRHSNLDILISHQSLAKITTTEWQNMTWLRLHKQVDDIYRYRNRIPNYPLVRMATFIVEEQYNLANHAYEQGWIDDHEFVKRKSYFIYLDMRRLKIRGCSRKAFIRAAKRYIDQEENKKVKMLCQETDAHGVPLYAKRTDAVFQLISNYLRFHEVSELSPIEEREERRKEDDGENQKMAA